MNPAGYIMKKICRLFEVIKKQSWQQKTLSLTVFKFEASQTIKAQKSKVNNSGRSFFDISYHTDVLHCLQCEELLI